MPARHIVNGDELDPERPAPDEFGFERRRLARGADAEALGCSLYVIPPGGRSWPYHYHTANEEAAYVLEGRGTVRTPDGAFELRPGDYIAFPRGEPGTHQFRNGGDEPFRYLCLSTMVEPDVTVYPDADMVGLFAGSPPGGRSADRTLHRYLRADAEVEYWDESA